MPDFVDYCRNHILRMAQQWILKKMTMRGY